MRAAYAAYPDAPPATGYGNFAVSGGSGGRSAHEWCSGCGRRLGWDGRCERCDAWWASPLVQAGAPCVAAALIFLAFLIGTLRTGTPVKNAAARTNATAPLLSAPAPPPPVFQPVAITAPFARPVAMPPAGPPQPFDISSLPTDPAAPSPALAELERLRDLAHSVDAAVAADASAGTFPVSPAGPSKSLALPVSTLDE